MKKESFSFKPEDFDKFGAPHELSGSSNPDRKQLADFCNAKVKEWLDAAPTLRGNWLGENNGASKMYAWPQKKPTHQGKLVCIEKLEGGE